MRYNLKSYRLHQETVLNLEEIKKRKGLSYNKLFLEFINLYKNMETKKTRKDYDEEGVKEGSLCPYCQIGTIRLKKSRYGQFLACDDFPHCGFTQNIKEDLDVGQKGYKE